VEERFITQTVFMYGIRAINYYMLAERDRWMGCPIQRDGTRRDDYFDLYTRWNACLKKLAWHKLRPERKILLLTSRTYDRLKYISREAAFPQQWLLSVYTKLPDDLFESERTLGERDNIAAGAAAWILALRTALEALGESYAISDSDISAEKLAEYSLVIAPTFDWADKNYLDKLAGYVKSGGKLLGKLHLSGKRCRPICFLTQTLRRRNMLGCQSYPAHWLKKAGSCCLVKPFLHRVNWSPGRKFTSKLPAG
jgi:beta-galactosidase